MWGPPLDRTDVGAAFRRPMADIVSIEEIDRLAKRATDAKRPLKTLERVLSKAGLGSRVDARRWIHAGRVKVNGTVVRNPDHWIDMERDRVRVDGRPLAARARVYLLLYKPTG